MKKAWIAAGAMAFATTLFAQGMGQGMGPGHGKGMMHGGGGGCCMSGAENTSGWGMMSREERDAHHQTMMGFKSRGECDAYMAKHHAEMQQRAAQRGMGMQGMPRHNMCAQMQEQGKLK